MASFLPPTEQLLAFKAVVDRGSFTAAANELAISQSAVSHQIARLEKRLGVRLLKRSARGLTRTDAGEALLAAIAEPLSRLVEAFDEYAHHGPAQHLKIQVESAFAAAWLSPRLSGFLSRYPMLRLDQFRATTLLLEGVELAIKWGNGNWSELQAEPLLNIFYTPVCSPKIVASGKLGTVGDLTRFPLLHDRSYREWQRWLKAFVEPHRHPQRGHLADDSYILVEMAIEGRGIALAAPQLLQRELANGNLVCPFPDRRLFLDEAYHLVIRRDARLTSQARSFVEWIKGEAATDRALLETS